MRIGAPIPFFFFLRPQNFFWGSPKKNWGCFKFFVCFFHSVFSITINLTFFFGIPCAQPTVTVCCRCYKRSKKASKKDLAHPDDHLEHSLRPIHTTQVNPGPFWTRQKKDWKPFRLQIKIIGLDTYFPLKERHNSLSFWNSCVLLILPFCIVGWFKIQIILKLKKNLEKKLCHHRPI